MPALRSIEERLNSRSVSTVERIQREMFITTLQSMEPNRARALSVSCGDGIWDYLALSQSGIRSITATDVVDCPVKESDRRLLQDCGDWEYVRVEPDKPLPFDERSFDLVFSEDVIEHTRRPSLFLREQYRVLKDGGLVLVGTPNLFRPANLVRAIVGRLHFPVRMGRNTEIGEYVHQEEFYEGQLLIMMEEAGFSNITIQPAYFGLSMMNLSLSKSPRRGVGRIFAHFLHATGTK